MDASVLAHVLRAMPAITDPNVLVDSATADDAGVYRLTSDIALVLTVDFFTPIVDDPRAFGSIAAANSLSDVYAMGARPLAALAVTAFPESGLDESVLVAILSAGAEKAAEAGIAVIGGHTVKDPEPKYGLSVVGTVHPDRIVRNSTARQGDVLVLTKALGTGILTTARRRDTIGDDELAEAVASMSTLNRTASDAMLAAGAHAATDVTGFGFLGHLQEMLDGAGVGAEIDSAAVPLFDRALSLAESNAPGGTKANLARAIERGVSFAANITQAQRLVLSDAQTSGGLLIAVDPSNVASLLTALASAGVNRAAAVGRIIPQRALRIA